MNLSNSNFWARQTESLPILRRICQLGLGVGILLLFSTGNVMAQRLSVIVDGSHVHFEGMGPVQVEGHILVPVRGVLEKLGAEVAWMPESQTVVASTGKMEIVLHIRDTQAKVNGKMVELDTPAQVLSGHTMVPLRFLSESLGADVRWDDASRTVIIVTRNRQNVNRPDGVEGRDRDRDRDRKPDDRDRKSGDPDAKPPR
jgi:hypothetical protein